MPDFILCCIEKRMSRMHDDIIYRVKAGYQKTVNSLFTFLFMPSSLTSFFPVIHTYFLSVFLSFCPHFFFLPSFLLWPKKRNGSRTELEGSIKSNIALTLVTLSISFLSHLPLSSAKWKSDSEIKCAGHRGSNAVFSHVTCHWAEAEVGVSIKCSFSKLDLPVSLRPQPVWCEFERLRDTDPPKS